MLGLFKKKLFAKNRAYLISQTSSEYLKGLEDVLNDFLVKYPKYQAKRNNLIDELQWMIPTGGLIAIRMLSEHKKAKETYKQLIELYRAVHLTNNKTTMFDDIYLKKLDTKFDNYLCRFNRGIGFRDPNSNSLNESLIDVANESMQYFTGEIRYSEILSFDDLAKVQERPEPNELELFIKDILYQFVREFISKFEKFKLV